MYFATSYPYKLYEIDVDSGVSSFSTTLTNIPTTVYKNLSSGNLTYYYAIQQGYYNDPPYTLYSVTNSVKTVVDKQFYGGNQFSIDRTGKYLYAISEGSHMYQYTISNGANTTLHGTSKGDFPVGGCYESLSAPYYDPVVTSTGVLFTAGCSGSYDGSNIALYNFSSNTTDYLTYGWENTHAGFFQCEAETLDVLPTDAYKMSPFCSNNGIAWYTGLISPLYFFPSYAEAYVQSLAVEQCPVSLDTICTTIGNLPPYICSKKDYLPFFTMLSTALANAQSLLTILCFVFGLLLPRISECFGIAVPKRTYEPTKSSDLEMGAIYEVVNMGGKRRST